MRIPRILGLTVWLLTLAKGAATPPAGQKLASDRPRLLSYTGRWGRARRWLPADAHQVADIGCASGYGTAALTGTGHARRRVVGLEPDASQVRQAGRQFPWLPLLRGDAGALPIRDGAVDAVVLLDVLEHVADPSAVIAEVHRVLRPGGYLVISVPHASPLAILDPMNAYSALRRRWSSWPALEALVDSATGVHRHFAASEVCALLGPGFTVNRMARTGLGLSEVLRLVLLVTFKGFLRWDQVYRGLWFLPLVVYLLDDLIPAGPLSYHLTIGGPSDGAGGDARRCWLARLVLRSRWRRTAVTTQLLLARWPVVGHISPFLNVETAIQLRGHEVAFVTGETVRETSECAAAGGTACGSAGDEAGLLEAQTASRWPVA